MLDTLLIRADGSVSMGTGHLLRCLALAQAWQEGGGQMVWACAECPEPLRPRLQAVGTLQTINSEIGSVADAQQTAALAKQYKAKWLVLDGYDFNSDYFNSLKQVTDCSLLTLDDGTRTASELEGVDAILNPNASANIWPYLKILPSERIWGGPQFALLRREFRLRSKNARSFPEKTTRVLITMGGTDPYNLAPRALAWLKSQDFRGTVVVLYGAKVPQWDGDIHFEVSFIRAAAEVPNWMAWCDVALAAAGSTTWELAFCGTPSILSVVAPNQLPLATWVSENDMALNIEKPDDEWEVRLARAWSQLEPMQIREQMSRRAQELIDGQGAARVIARIEPNTLQLRAVTMQAAPLLWEWRNDATTRAMSFQSEPVPWDSHRVWMQGQLTNPNALLLIGCKGDEAIGHVRFKREEDEAVISVMVAPQWRGQGIGAVLIKGACHACFSMWNPRQIRALIKPENVASCRAFEKAGFTRQTDTNPMPANLEFVLEPPA